MRALIMKMAGLISYLKQFVKYLKNMTNENYKRMVYQNIVRRASCSGGSFLRYFLVSKINSSIMFLLQAISWFTTLAGAVYYFSGINSIAPVCFASAIQLGLLYYAKSFSDSDVRKISHGFLLVLFTTISMAFSYTGMAISSVPPEHEYQISYEKYAVEAESVKTELLEKKFTDREIEYKLTDFWVKMRNAEQKADNKINELDTNISEQQKIASTGSTESVTTGRDSNGNPTKTIKPYVTEAGNNAIKEITALTTAKTEIANAKNDFSTAMTKLSEDEVLKYVRSGEKDLTDRENTELPGLVIDLISKYNALTTKIGENALISENLINDLRGRYQDVRVISNITLEELNEENNGSTAASTTTSMDRLLKAVFEQDSTAVDAQENLKKRKDAVNNNYNELKKWVNESGADTIDLTNLTAAKEELEAFGDPNVMAFKYLFQSEYFNKVIGVLILAILVDGVTFLLGLLGHKNRLSLLNPNTSKELINDEEQLFSIVFVALTGMKLPDNLNTSGEKTFHECCYAYVNGIKVLIQEFLDKFSNSPWTEPWGYGLYAYYSEIVKIEGAVSIISLLHQLGFLEFLSKSDFQMFKDKYNGKNTNVTYNKDNTADELEDFVCILKYRVEMYLRYNTAEISTYFLDETLMKEGLV